MGLISKCADGGLSAQGIPIPFLSVSLLKLGFEVEVVEKDSLLSISAHSVPVNALVDGIYLRDAFAAEKLGIILVGGWSEVIG